MSLHALVLLLFFQSIQPLSAEMQAPVLKSHSTLVLTVQPEERITLTCDITEKYEVSWYLLSSEELTLLILAEKTRTQKSLPFSYSKNESHFILTTDIDITVANLTIVSVGANDLGLYFCGSKADWSPMHFARPIRLQFKDLSSQKPPKEKEENAGYDRVLMLGAVAVVALVFLVASVAAGMVIHQRAWRAGWAAGRDSSQRRSGKR